MKFRKLFMALLVTTLLIGLFAVPASANTYDAYFSYYVLNKTTGSYDFISNYSYSFADASARSYDVYGTTLVNVGYNDAPEEYRTAGYTYRSEYTYTKRADPIYNYEFRYNINYYFDPVAYTVAYQLDGSSYQTQSCYYKDTVSVLPAAPTKTGYTFSGWSSSDVTLTGGSFTMPAQNVTIKGTYLVHSNLVKYQYVGSIPQKNAPALPAASNYNYGTLVHVASLPSAPGYTFDGWSSGNFTMPDNPVTISGSWTPRTDTTYTVEYYQQNINDDNYELADTEHCTGTTDTMAIFPEKSYPGFTMTPDSVTASTSTNIDGDGTTLLKLYYDRNVNTVTYTYSGETDVTPPALPAQATYRYGQAVILATAPTLPGYDFGGWETSDVGISEGKFTMKDGPVSITGIWTPRNDTAFTVEYYQQNVEDDDYTLAYTFNGEGTTGGNIPHKEFTGFTEVPDSVTAEGNTRIKSDGTLLLKLYYDRNVNAVTYTYSGETDVTPPALPTQATYRYGQTVTLSAAPTLPGYDFGSWETSDVTVTDGSFTMPDGPVAITGNWTARTDTPFTIEYYQQDIADDDYTLAYTFNSEGTTGGNVPHKEFTGFTEVSDSVTAEGNTRIKSDGTGILKLYYDRERFTVTYAYTGRSAGDTVPEDAPELPATASYRYGQTVTLPAQPQSKGTLRFLGWALDGTLTNALDFALEKDVAITGYWYTPTYSDGGGDNDKAAYSAVLIPDSTATDIVLQSDSSNRVTFLAPPEKEGCTFAGWATEFGGDAAYHAGDTITLTRNCVFYAVYYRQIAPYIIGFTDNTFRPGSNLTLKQGALMLKRLGVSTQITSSNLYFTRRVFLSLICSATGADTRSQDPMSLAVEKGWIIGFTDGTLRSDDYITRAQAATILDRVFRQGDTLVKDGRSFADIPQTHWASDAISRASITSTIRV